MPSDQYLQIILDLGNSFEPSPVSAELEFVKMSFCNICKPTLIEGSLVRKFRSYEQLDSSVKR